MGSVKIAVVAVAAAAGGLGVGLGAYSLGSASEPAAPQAGWAAEATTATPAPVQVRKAPAPTPAPDPAPSSPLTLDQAKQVAARAASAPGRVIEWDEDSEPTGLRYDVTLLHADGSTTDVEVDTVTGRVTSIKHDDNRD